MSFQSILHDLYLLVIGSRILGFPGSSDGKESACNPGDSGLILGSFSLEKEMATRSNILGEFHGQ